MSGRTRRHSGTRSRSRSSDRSRNSGRSGSRKRIRRDDERPWLRRSESRSESESSSSRSSSSRRKGRKRSETPVRPVMSKEPKFLNSRVFVANLASDKTSNGELLAMFEKHGRVLDTLVHHNGYGFVQFATEEEGRKAVAAENGNLFHGKKIKCNMAAEGKRGPSGGRIIERPPGESRYSRDRSPLPEPYPLPYNGPYLRSRDLPPLPPRDPYFDDPYRRPPPPDPYFDRYRDDPFRRDLYVLDPYRDPYRDPYAVPLFDPAVPKKPITVDCEIITMTAQLRPYADMVDRRLKNLNLLTSIVIIREDRTIQQQVEDATRRSCLFAVVINSQNEIHRSLTLNILHGVAQEHRNMPLDDALSLVARSFEKFLQAEKVKVAALSGGDIAAAPTAGGLGSAASLTPPKEISYLLNLLADSRQLTVAELDKVIAYLKERKDKLLIAEGRRLTAEVPSPEIQALQQQQQLQQEQQQQQHQELQNKILSIMNGSSATTVPTGLSVTQNALASSASSLIMSASARPPPPPPQQASSAVIGPQPRSAQVEAGAASRNVLLGTTTQNPLLAVASPTSVSAVQGPTPAATLINFDNPTVQKALDNLIQSGPNLLRNIAGQAQWPGQGTSATMFSSGSTGQQHPPF